MNSAIQGLSQNNLTDRISGSSVAAENDSAGAGFMNTLRSAMDQVNAAQTDADGKVAQLLTGNGQDIHSAMIAVEKANLTFEMMVQVRNKIVQAYQQVSAIPF